MNRNFQPLPVTNPMYNQSGNLGQNSFNKQFGNNQYGQLDNMEQHVELTKGRKVIKVPSNDYHSSDDSERSYEHRLTAWANEQMY